MEHIGVCVILVNKEGQILLGKRKNGYGEGLYGIPGGRVEGEEKLVDCARREVKEEVGIDIDVNEYVGVVREFQKTYNFIHFGFVEKDVDDKVYNPEPDKCEGWEWHSLDNLPDILPGHSKMIEMYNSGEKITDLISSF